MKFLSLIACFVILGVLSLTISAQTTFTNSSNAIVIADGTTSAPGTASLYPSPM